MALTGLGELLHKKSPNVVQGQDPFEQQTAARQAYNANLFQSGVYGRPEHSHHYRNGVLSKPIHASMRIDMYEYQRLKEDIDMREHIRGNLCQQLARELMKFAVIREEYTADCMQMHIQATVGQVPIHQDHSTLLKEVDALCKEVAFLKQQNKDLKTEAENSLVQEDAPHTSIIQSEY